MNLTLCPECGEEVPILIYDFHADMCTPCAKEREIELAEVEFEDDDYFHPVVESDEDWD